jgi:hypothetical protein
VGENIDDIIVDASYKQFLVHPQLGVEEHHVDVKPLAFRFCLALYSWQRSVESSLHYRIQ